MKDATQLQILAELNGILLQYKGSRGTQTASEQSLRAVLKSLGVAARSDDEIREALQLARHKPWIEGLEPVTILREGSRTMRFHLPAEIADRPCQGEVRLENGERVTWNLQPSQGHLLDSSLINGARFCLYAIDAPALPCGCHEITLQIAEKHFRTWAIVAPKTCYTSGDLARSWGLFMPVYAVHSDVSWGAGNLTDYARLSQWVGDLGGSFVGALPILAGFLEKPRCECSPYAPASRLFWNEFYIDVKATPEFAKCPQAQRRVHSEAFERQLERFRASPLVDYPAEMQARREILQLLAQMFFTQPSSRRDEFEAFVRARPEVESYARFRAVCEKSGKSWREWESRLQTGQLRSGDFDEENRRYHLYSQWIAQEQMDDFLERQTGGAARLYLDLPLGVNSDGYDVWHHREAFVEGVSAGAPPDLFFSLGQNWGFAPQHPTRARQDGYSYLRKVLAFHMRHTGLLRLDHVMSLHRLFWVPQGGEAKDGVYVRYPSEELYALLALESHRYKTVLVGENLGTVPAEVNTALRHRRIRTMYVMQFSFDAATGAIAAPEPHHLSAFGTHDMPTFAAFWRGEDIKERLRLKLISPQEAKAQRQERRKVIRAVEENLRQEGWLGEGKPTLQNALRACLSFLAASKTEMLQVSLEDLWLETEPQNVPGTADVQRSNWRAKARFTLNQIERMRRLKKLFTELEELRREREGVMAPAVESV